jgi:hypothetical protein
VPCAEVQTKKEGVDRAEQLRYNWLRDQKHWALVGCGCISPSFFGSRTFERSTQRCKTKSEIGYEEKQGDLGSLLDCPSHKYQANTASD